MLLKYGKIIETVMITILFCSFAYGQDNRPANLHPSRDIHHDITLIPQQTFQSFNDSNTTLIGWLAYGSCRAVDVSGNIAYFGIEGTLEVVDISDPANPVELGKVLTTSVVQGVTVSGSYAYVANGDAGLRIIDVSTPSSPQEVGFFDTGGNAFGVAVSGSYAYVADRVDGLRIIDVSTPSSPQEVGFFDTGGMAYGVAVSGSYAYVADRWDGLRIIDISTPSGPIEVGFFDTDVSAFGVAVSGSYAFVANGFDGMYIIQNDLLVGINEEWNHVPENFLLSPNYPNPFNPVTTIPYQLPKSAFVNLSIYSITGQLVETIVNGYKSTGLHTVEW
ncbi:MAG: hypothetical protein IID16_00450, partial [Candidatus Marinimicrobia bacterium]|nr:hypothetical protein [Candidatus Neomarinimicrobiota bacterium]